MSLPSVDVHQHLWPEPFVSALSRRSEPPCLRGRVLRLAGAPDTPVDLGEHRLETRLRRLDAAGTDVALVSLQPTLGLDGLPPEEAQGLVETYHAGVRELVDASGGRLHALAHAEAREGFAGATVAAPALADAVVGGRALPLLGELARSERLLFVHPGPAPQPPAAPPWWGEVVSYGAQMQAAYLAWMTHGARAYPRLRVVFAILAGGGPVQFERLRSRGVDLRAGAGGRVFLDTASYGRRALELALQTLGVGALVFGSDAPVLDAGRGLRALHEFGNAVFDLVRKENPSLLLR